MKEFIKLLNGSGIQIKSYQNYDEYLEIDEGKETIIVTKEEKQQRIVQLQAMIEELEKDIEAINKL